MQIRIQHVTECLQIEGASPNAIFAVIGLVADRVIKFCPVCGHDLEDDINRN